MTCHSCECRPGNCLSHCVGSLHQEIWTRATGLRGDCLAATLLCISISHLLNNVAVIDRSREMIRLLPTCVFVVPRLDTGHVRAIIGLDLLFLLLVMLLLSARSSRLFNPQAPWIKRLVLMILCVCLWFRLHFLFNWYSYSPLLIISWSYFSVLKNLMKLSLSSRGSSTSKFNKKWSEMGCGQTSKDKSFVRLS